MESHFLDRCLARRRAWLLPLALLAGLVLLSAAGNYLHLRGHVVEMARHYAEGITRLINDARLWNAEHGGVYVPVSETVSVNQYLKHPRRDLTTSDGQALTMINPAYMTRQIAEVTKRQAGLVIHLTSRQPVNPDNAADPWETEALQAFAADPGIRHQRLALASGPEGELFRYMIPLRIQKPCLSCHAADGYQEGDLRGGISVSFPAGPHFALINSQIGWMLAGHGAAFILVGAMLVLLLNRLQEQWLAAKSLLASQEATIASRTESLAASKRHLEEEIVARRAAEEDLRQQMERYQTIINTAAEGYWQLDAELRTVLVNEALCAMLGYSREEILGREPTEFADHRNADIFRQQLANRDLTLHRAFNVVLRTKDGHERQLRFHATSLFDHENRLRGSFAFVTDITELLQIRESAAAYALELERSNRELQDFAHIASHDLQEPLRTIVSFGDRLLLKYTASLDDKGRDYLERMQKAALRMQQLIEDLLNYSRVTRRNGALKPVSLGEVVAEVKEDLGQLIREKQATVEVAELPVVSGDRSQLHSLFQNLIGNALKFQSPDAAPRVEISARKLNDEQVEITVADNGIGFDEKYLDRIFRPFQRLHGRDVYQGTGMGLTICKKIAERHHGKIIVKSAPGQGAVFKIILPG